MRRGILDTTASLHNAAWQVVLAAAKRGKLGKSIASAGAKSVSSLNAILSRTSKAVKVNRYGVACSVQRPFRRLY